MSNADRLRGRKLELRYIALLRLQERWAERIDGAADIVTAVEGERPVLIQVKGTSKPYERFGPDDRARLRIEARVAGFDCALVWCPKGRRLSEAEWIDEADWPTTETAPLALSPSG